jgi:hypothetical protein|tara:strand:+ start:479 stop:715 length:237 start_codon:yes stop_codon:yes gene_type:complete
MVVSDPLATKAVYRDAGYDELFHFCCDHWYGNGSPVSLSLTHAVSSFLNMDGHHKFFKLTSLFKMKCQYYFSEAYRYG